jgi:signal peptidase
VALRLRRHPGTLGFRNEYTVRFIRLLGNIALWLGALLGVAAGSLSLAGALGWAQPLIVISGSMEPGIHTGDLLIATKANSADLEVGDVVSLPSDLTHKLVTHRITQIEPADDGGWKIYMKGDANEFEDIAPYFIGDEVWRPAVQIPHVGFAVSKLMQPSVSLPIVIALGALLGMSLLDGKRPENDNDDEDDIDDDDDTERLERPADIPLPMVNGSLLLEPDHLEPMRVEPTVVARARSDDAALAEIDEALAALGICFDTDATSGLDRDAFDPDVFDSDLFEPIMSG